ncbi:helix-turn-helix transcriptional regulator [Phycisphaerales bacterium AB-hyl4]|uniref:Helix-turn-helix transcriptional regulator n=1 Tax=Natronomicrosphaera hydrolytica TaxID=3242702 RepID=A0ABV4U0I7_9BACT
MELDIYQPLDTEVLWRVSTFGRQRVAAGQTYAWDNAARLPVGRVVVQSTLAGTIRYRDAHGEQRVGPGDLMLVTYGESSAYGSSDRPLDEPYACHWACLDGVGLVEHVQAFRKQFGSVIPLGLHHPLLTEVDELIAMARPTAGTSAMDGAAMVYGLIMRLFEHAEQQRMQQLSPVQRAVDFLVREPCRVMSLEAVARRYGCSREHLSRLFHERTQQTPNTYINAAKTRRSLRLLQHTDLPLSEVASQAGFPSVKTMRRHVRTTTGQTPQQTREHATMRVPVAR